MFVESLKDARIIVTGGAGFIGSHLVERLLEMEVSSITVIDNIRYGSQANLPLSNSKLSLHPIDIGSCESSDLLPLFANSDYVFHLAAEKLNASVDTPNRMLSTNIQGSLNVFEAARIQRVKRVIFTSSLYAYGRSTGAPYCEDEVIKPQTVYGISKVAGEHLSRMYTTQGLETVVLRYLFVYGPRQWANAGYKSVIVKNFERLIEGREPIIYGNGSQTLDYIYVSDVVEASIRALMSAPNGSVLNVGSGKDTNILDLTKTMMEIAKSKGTIQFQAPDWTHGSYRVANISKIRGSLNWTPQINLREGLIKTYQWLLSR